MSHLLPLITAVGRKFLPMQMCYFVMSHQIASALYLGTKRGGGWDRMWLQMEPKGFLKHRLKIEDWGSDAFSSKNPWKGESSVWRQKSKAGWGREKRGPGPGPGLVSVLLWANPRCCQVVRSGFDRPATSPAPAAGAERGRPRRTGTGLQGDLSDCFPIACCAWKCQILALDTNSFMATSAVSVGLF